jgi:hypothetical protein
MPAKKKQSSEAAVREIRRRARHFLCNVSPSREASPSLKRSISLDKLRRLLPHLGNTHPAPHLDENVMEIYRKWAREQKVQGSESGDRLWQCTRFVPKS